jgi:hypothetical protein
MTYKVYVKTTSLSLKNMFSDPERVFEFCYHKSGRGGILQPMWVYAPSTISQNKESPFQICCRVVSRVIFIEVIFHAESSNYNNAGECDLVNRGRKSYCTDQTKGLEDSRSKCIRVKRSFFSLLLWTLSGCPPAEGFKRTTASSYSMMILEVTGNPIKQTTNNSLYEIITLSSSSSSKPSSDTIHSKV